MMVGSSSKEPTSAPQQSFMEASAKIEVRPSIVRIIETDKRCNFCIPLRRFTQTRIGQLHLTQSEADWLEKKEVTKARGPHALRILCWRRSMLQLAIFFYGVQLFQFMITWIVNYSTITEAMHEKRCQVMDVWSESDEQRLSDCQGMLPDRNRTDLSSAASLLAKALQMQVQEQLHKVRFAHAYTDLFIIGGKLGGLSFAIKALKIWTDMVASVRFTRFSFVLGSAPKFLLLMLIPFRSLISTQDLQRDMCKVVIDSSFGLRAQLTEKIAAYMPADFCDKKPSEWPAIMNDTFTRAGAIKAQGGESCVQSEVLAQAIAQDVVTHGQGSIGTSGNCTGCTGCMDMEKCPSHVLAQAAALGPTAVLIVAHGSTSEARKVFESVARCADACPVHCFQGCASNPDFQARLLGQIPMDSAFGSALASLCVDDSSIKEVQVLADLVERSIEAAILYMAGTIEATLCLKALLPAIFSLVLGMMRGARIARMIVPYSRLPGWMIGGAIVFTLPPLSALLSVANNMFGDACFAIAVSLALLLMCLLLPNDWMSVLPWHKKTGNIASASVYAGGVEGMSRSMLEPATHDEAEYQFNVRWRYLSFVKLALLLVICVFIGTNALLRIAVIEAASANIGTIVCSAVASVLSIFGEALVGLLFFADAYFYMLSSVHMGQEREDTVEVKNSRMFLLHDVSSVYYPSPGHMLAPQGTV